LLTLEAAGRLLSFTDAASELNVTRLAVCQQIRSLEKFLGVQLFNRCERYHRAISAVLTEVVRATIPRFTAPCA
jgi:LysR family glycine cleavage system transcriptional activator